jgi:HAD superfamily, subfamily IIIB (Acid phosphatase)
MRRNHAAASPIVPRGVFLFLASLALLAGCKCPRPSQVLIPNAPSASTNAPFAPIRWFQRAEASAGYLQCFKLGRTVIDELLTNAPPDLLTNLPANTLAKLPPDILRTLPRNILSSTNMLAQTTPDFPAAALNDLPPKLAIITDIDETILDNSEYQASLAEQHASYSLGSWKRWTRQARAPATPGTSNFLSFVAHRGIEIFYVSNRESDEAAATLANLRKEGFPCADLDHLKLKTGSSSKHARREEIAHVYFVCLFLGDNLSDFNDAFGGPDQRLRKQEIEKFGCLFGSRYIVFPNPMYGDWQRKEEN